MQVRHFFAPIATTVLAVGHAAASPQATQFLGFDPVAYGIAAVSPSTVQDCIEVPAWSGPIPAWQQAHADLAALTTESKLIQSKAFTDGQSDDLQGQLSTLSLQIAAKREQLKQLESALQAAILSEIKEIDPSADTQLAARYLANRHRKAPDAAKVLELTEAEWADLQAALILVEAGLELTTEQQAVYTKMQTSADVALAQQRITANGPAIKAKLNELLIADSEAESAGVPGM